MASIVPYSGPMFDSFTWHAGTQRALSALMHGLGRDRFRREDFVITPLDVAVPGLDKRFDQYRIVHFTDIHFGHWVTVERLQGIVKIINEQSPDLVVNTGDFVSYVLEDLAADMVATLGRISATDGSTAVLGNHDHIMGADRVTELLEAAGVIVLRNELHTIWRGDAALHIAGVDDVSFEADRLDLLMNQIPPSGPAMMLAHEPDFADQTSATERFFLQLSGHSHGTQLVPPFFGPVLRGNHFRKYPNGRYQVGGMVQYTSNGVGTHALRLRINCPPEIVVVTLHSV